MSTIRGMLEKFRSLDTDLLVEQSVSETTDQYANLNTEQLHQGLNADGEQIGQYRNELYATMKHEMNPLPGFGVPDLRLTGAFYAGIRSVIQGDAVVTESTDEKNTALVEKYGHLFGLSDKFRQEYVNGSLRPRFRQKVRDVTGV
ncbi:MAG: hypothetical protein Q8943_17440 [Bacteroidota bacterium]|nr:hypothetical protein [Bacteroidota bacterium]